MTNHKEQIFLIDSLPFKNGMLSDSYSQFELLAFPVKKFQHTTTFHYINSTFNTSIPLASTLTDFSIVDIHTLFCDASMYGVNNFEKPIAHDLPNSILAGVIKNQNNDILSFKKPIICRDNNIAELYAINEGLQIASLLGITSLNIYTDSSVSLTFIRKHVEQHTKYMKNDKFFPITQEIIDTLQSFHTCNFYHVPRKFNKQADKITKHTKSLMGK